MSKGYISRPHEEFDTFFKNINQYIALAWQNERGNTGAWSEILNAIIS